MKNIYSKFTCLIFVTTVLVSCEVLELDLTTDPNQLSIEQSDPNLLLNDIQVDFRGIWNGFNNPSRDIIRMENLFGSYGDQVSVTTFDTNTGEWASAYRSAANVQLLQNQLAAGLDIPVHVGIT